MAVARRSTCTRPPASFATPPTSPSCEQLGGGCHGPAPSQQHPAPHAGQQLSQHTEARASVKRMIAMPITQGRGGAGQGRWRSRGSTRPRSPSRPSPALPMCAMLITQIRTWLDGARDALDAKRRRLALSAPGTRRPPSRPARADLYWLGRTACDGLIATGRYAMAACRLGSREPGAVGAGPGGDATRHGCKVATRSLVAAAARLRQLAAPS